MKIYDNRSYKGIVFENELSRNENLIKELEKLRQEFENLAPGSPERKENIQLRDALLKSVSF